MKQVDEIFENLEYASNGPVACWLADVKKLSLGSGLKNRTSRDCQWMAVLMSQDIRKRLGNHPHEKDLNTALRGLEYHVFQDAGEDTILWSLEKLRWRLATYIYHGGGVTKPGWEPVLSML